MGAMSATASLDTPIIPQPHKAGHVDRLGLTLFLAAAFHALIILGVSFDLIDRLKQKGSPLPMEITLVHAKSDDSPDEADYLAQSNQRGGGNVSDKVRPSSPFPNPRQVETEGQAQRNQNPASPPPAPTEKQIITATRAEKSVSAPTEQPDTATPELPTAAQLMQRSREIARLSAEIRQRQQAYASKPREKYISANTKEYKLAAYEDSWRLKVERIGNLNYPDEAKRSGLTGTLVLDVAIDHQGKVVNIELLRSSGHKVLDDGAIRIVKLASPFAPLPESIRKETDILHIVRAWQFQSGNQLETLR